MIRRRQSIQLCRDSWSWGRRWVGGRSSVSFKQPWKGQGTAWTVIHTMPVTRKEKNLQGKCVNYAALQRPCQHKNPFSVSLPQGNLGMPVLRNSPPPPPHPPPPFPCVLKSCQNKRRLQPQHMSCIGLFRKCLRRAQVCINKPQQRNPDKWMES